MNCRKALLMILLPLFTGTVTSQTINVLTYNIRYDNPGDGSNAWTKRRTWLCSQVKQVNPGIFGVQEALISQMNFLDSTFSDYRHAGVGRSDGKTKGEFSAIFYNTMKFKLIKQGTFWLSPTPGRVSVGWDAALERICTYALFETIETGRRFWAFNTHFDHIGVKARRNSADLILKKIKTINKGGFPVILMGDFNSEPGSEPYSSITSQMQDTKIADKSMTMGPDGTFNGFDASKAAVQRIDFIFTGKTGISILNYNVLREQRDGLFASDHYPVVSELRLE
jgi:endonuclease/exonuclease/phosphatase family metal-dependent hydrolase